MAIAPYAQPSDLQGYLPGGAGNVNDAQWTIFLSVASRFIDEKCGTYFFDDGISTKRFDGEGTAHFDFGMHAIFGKAGSVAPCDAGATTLTYTQTYGLTPAAGDSFILDMAFSQETVTVQSVTQVSSTVWTLNLSSPTKYQHTQQQGAIIPCSTISVQLAYFENQPPGQWVTPLSGDGITPPTNYYLWPRNPFPLGSSAAPTLYRPWEAIDIAHIPISNTFYLPASIPGYATISVMANWGWPAVPDLIKDLTCKIAVRLWQAESAGFMNQLGGAPVSLTKIPNIWGPMDSLLLQSSSFIKFRL